MIAGPIDVRILRSDAHVMKKIEKGEKIFLVLTHACYLFLAEECIGRAQPECETPVTYYRRKAQLQFERHSSTQKGNKSAWSNLLSPQLSYSDCMATSLSSLSHGILQCNYL